MVSLDKQPLNSDTGAEMPHSMLDYAEHIIDAIQAIMDVLEWGIDYLF